jgi:hypothetical protein
MTGMQDLFPLRTALHAAVNIRDDYVACDRALGAGLDRAAIARAISCEKSITKNQRVSVVPK